MLELDHVGGGEVIVLVEDVVGVKIGQRAAPPHGVVVPRDSAPRRDTCSRMKGQSQENLVVPLDVPLAAFASRDDDRKTIAEITTNENANATRITVRCAGGTGEVTADFGKMGQEPKPLALH